MTDLPVPKLSRLAPLAAAGIAALAVSFTAAAQVARGGDASPTGASAPTLASSLADTRDALRAAMRAPCWTPCHLDDIVLDHAQARLSD